MGNLSIILILFTLTACGKNLELVKKQPKLDVQTTFNDSFQNLDGSVTEPKPSSKFHRILIFSQDTCLVCAEEAQTLRDYLQKNGGLPTQVELLTLLVGVDVADAQSWVDYFQIKWPVGVMSNQAFLKYCPENKVPCINIERQNAGIIFHHLGAIEIKKLQEITGEWY